MIYFHYSGRRDNNSIVQGWVMAEAREDAIATLHLRHIQPFVVKEGRGEIPLRVPEEELLATLRELSSLRGSGMALDKAVSAVVNSTENRQLLSSWNAVSEMVRSGLSLSESFAARPEAFPRFVVPLVRLGEANGNLQSALNASAERLEEQMKLHSEVKTALTYPAFLLIISVSVLLFLFLAVIPKFGDMVGDMGGDTGSAIATLIAVSEFLRDYFFLWGGALVCLVVVTFHGWREGKLQSWLWSVLQKVPGVKGLLQALEIVQFCGSMKRLLPEGVGLLEATQLSSETLARDDTRLRLNMSVECMRQGDGFAQALRKQDLFTPLVLQMIEVGESAASLPVSMEEISKLYERRLREGIKRFLSLLEPAVIVSMGLMVGGIMVSLLSAIMSMNDLPL